MKKLLLILFTAITIAGCKKSESEKSNNLVTEVTGVTSGSYSISITNVETLHPLLIVDNKTTNETFEDQVKSGDEFRVFIKATSGCNVEFKYKGKRIGGQTLSGDSKNNSTIKIP